MRSSKNKKKIFNNPNDAPGEENLDIELQYQISKILFVTPKDIVVIFIIIFKLKNGIIFYKLKKKY